MDREHDFDTDEICSETVSDKSKITPRLCAEFVGVGSVDKVMEISRRGSDEPKVGNITLELRDTDRFETSER